jgi:hypothetical protein
MPHYAATPQPSLPHKLLSRRRVVLSCVAVAAVVLLVAAQTTEDPSRRRPYLVDSILGCNRKYPEASASTRFAGFPLLAVARRGAASFPPGGALSFRCEDLSFLRS